ncbi:MFS transporter [Pseudonocardia abyssalis]|uniref:MFS transporter n=1 Tax=Pseudonocardia abyssalis TaxID=2792008 RepID=A0ABS6UPN9_9PSEU|nr:MFS transporter [Pseudonocardia abyssalis]MBW0117543.1 MFS transporter [Pseudonocardia abyssalis]MBW0134190.1 MFS transporter [Pseudonocardia abyssalis]
MHSPGRTAVLLGLLFGLAGTSTSAVTVALPQLSAELGVTAATAAWIVSGYTVALAVATPLHGRLADMAGIRLPLTVGVAMMSAGAVGAALAPNFGVLMVARVLQGAGAASVAVLGTALISARWSGEQRGAALGRVAGVAGTLSALGPLLGGALESLGGWRWSVALPVVGLLAIPALWRGAPAGGSGEPVDKVGALLVAVAASGLVLLIQSPSAGIVAGSIGAVLLAAGAPAVAWWIRRRPDGFLPRSIVTNVTVLRSAFAAAAVPASWFALLLGVPLAAASWGWTPLATGLLLVPAALVGFVSPPIARRLLARLGGRRTIALACPTAVVALLIAALGGALESPWLLALAVVLVTIAFGVGQPAMISSVGAAVPGAQRGVALGIATLVFLTGASVGAALVGGLSSVIGVPAAFCLLIALPVLGIVALLIGGPDRVEPATAG